MTEKRFSLPYWISNNGDGSASIRLERSPQRAERQDELQNENEGWGEPCNGEIETILRDGKLYIEDSEYKRIDGKYQRIEFTYPIPLKGEQVEDDLSDLDKPQY